MPMKKNMVVLPEAIESDGPRIAREDTGMTVKQTSPGVMVMNIGKAQPSRPQEPEMNGTNPTKSKAKFSATQEAKARDPGQWQQPIRMPVTFGANDDKTGISMNRSTKLGYKKI